MSILEQLPRWLRPELAVKGLAVLVIGLLVAKALGTIAEKAALRRSDHHTGMLIGKVVYYALFILVAVLVLDVFNVRLPGDVQYVEKPLQIPDAAVGALGNPRDGFPAQGMTQQEAAERAVRTLYQAVIDQDLVQLKNVCPLCRNMGDEFLRAIIFKPDKPTRIVDIVEVGRIRKTGRSSLGPIVAVPTIVRLANGKKVEEQMIVQFRQFGDVVSCVVHGPWGLPREIE